MSLYLSNFLLTARASLSVETRVLKFEREPIWYDLVVCGLGAWKKSTVRAPPREGRIASLEFDERVAMLSHIKDAVKVSDRMEHVRGIAVCRNINLPFASLHRTPRVSVGLGEARGVHSPLFFRLKGIGKANHPARIWQRHADRRS